MKPILSSVIVGLFAAALSLPLAGCEDYEHDDTTYDRDRTIERRDIDVDTDLDDDLDDDFDDNDLDVDVNPAPPASTAPGGTTP